MGMNITDALKRAILESELSVNQIAERSGVAQPILSRFLSGRRTLKLPTVERLAAFFDIRVEQSARTAGEVEAPRRS